MRTVLTLLLAVCSSAMAMAAAGDPIDLQIRMGRYYDTTVVNEDGTAVETIEWSKTVLKESAVERSKRATVGFSTSAQKGEILAAYTLKADGRRIEVPKNNFQFEVNRGRDKDSPVYSDWTSMTVVFPDVAVGDSVVFSYRLTQTEPMFPRHYSTAQVFSRQVAYDDVRVRIEWPAALAARHEARGMKEVENGVQGDRKVVEWRYANPRPVKSDRRDFSVVDPDKEIGYAFSTFRSHAEIAAAYGARATPKAAVTDRIRQLAADIVKDTASRKEQARLLYEWVATHVTYAGNCIGIGAVVPRDLDFVLDNKMGDCKDHATLLQALLAARGIQSTQALVNSGSVYKVQKIPVVSMVNHVINYLPEFDLFVDSTSDHTPFGLLPHGDQDKPVLLVDGHRDGLKTPVPPASANHQHVRSVMRIAGDGAVSGSVEVSQNGHGAVTSRAWARKMTRDVEEDLVKNMFRERGMIGSGKFEKDDPKTLADHYRYKATLSAEKFIKRPGAGAFYIHPPLGIASTIRDAMQGSMETETEADMACSGGSIVEDYVIEFPKGMKVLSIPDGMKVSSDLLAYTATYRLKGNVLTVKRALIDHTRGNVCSPQLFTEFKKVAEKVLDNVKEQVLYK